MTSRTLWTSILLCLSLSISAVCQETENLVLQQQPLPTLETETFSIANLNARLRDEAGIVEHAAEVWIEARVRRVIRQGSPNTSITEDSVVNVPADANSPRGQMGGMALDGHGLGISVSGEQMMVVAPRQRLRQVQELLQTFEQFGIRQIVVQMQVLRDSVSAVKEMPINWSHVESASRIAQASAVLQEDPRASAQVQSVGYQPQKTLSAAARHLQKTQALPTELLPAPDGVTSANWTEATSVVERSTPLLYTLLDPDQYQTVMQHVRQSPTLERVMSPTVVVFNAQVATISNSIERPFVIGVKPVLVGDGDRQRVEFAPSVKVFPEGTTMKICPQLFDGKQVRLNYQLDICKVREVETLELPGIDGRGDFAVQMPEVASTQFRTCIDMPVGYTLAVSTFESDEHGQKKSVVIMCHCSLRDVEQAAPAGE